MIVTRRSGESLQVCLTIELVVCFGVSNFKSQGIAYNLNLNIIYALKRIKIKQISVQLREVERDLKISLMPQS